MNHHPNTRSESDLAQSAKSHVLKSLSHALILVVAAVGSNVAWAQDMKLLGVDWQCVQQHDEAFHVLCLPKPAGDGRVVPAVPAGFIKSSLPGRGDMRPVAERGLAEVFSAKAWSVPLYAQPGDHATVSRLLESVLCDTASNCAVTYRGN